jgi:hypothetical protein
MCHMFCMSTTQYLKVMRKGTWLHWLLAARLYCLNSNVQSSVVADPHVTGQHATQVSGGCCDDLDEAMGICKKLASQLKGAPDLRRYALCPIPIVMKM